MKDQNKRLLLITQVYPPDPAAVGQYMADVAGEMVCRGFNVTVFAANRGYDQPEIKFLAYEVLKGVRIKRFPLSSFGKKSIITRLLAAFFYDAQVVVYGLFERNLEAIIVSTSPPIAPLPAFILKLFHRAELFYWAMDINPDQLVRLGQTNRDSLYARLMDWQNHIILKYADYIVTLDSYMVDTLNSKYPVTEKVSIIPPWPLVANKKVTEPLNKSIRVEYNLKHKLVIMYSGNFSIAHPLDTLLKVALDYNSHPRLVFLFIGGGLQKPTVEKFVAENNMSNCLFLPYQPFDSLSISLAAADIHAVSMGNQMVGIVHPSKIYGAMAVGRPVLVLGPKESSLTELVDRYEIGWQVEHGDVDKMRWVINSILSMEPAKLAEMGKRARALAEGPFSSEKLLKEFCDLLCGIS